MGRKQLFIKVPNITNTNTAILDNQEVSKMYNTLKAKLGDDYDVTLLHYDFIIVDENGTAVKSS